jgi:hypothetical protein
MQDWFQWGYDGYSEELMRRMMVRANDDGRESDDDGHLLGETDDGRRCFGALPRGRKAHRTEGRQYQHTMDELLGSEFDDDEDDYDGENDEFEGGVVPPGGRRRETGATVRPKRVTVSSRPATISAVPPVLFGHTTNTVLGDDGKSSVALTHGGAAGASSTRHVLRGGGGFVDGAFVATSAVYVSEMGSGAAGFSRPTTQIVDCASVALFGHCSAPVTPWEKSASPTTKHETVFASFVLFGSNAPHATHLHKGTNLVGDAWLHCATRRNEADANDPAPSAASSRWSARFKAVGLTGHDAAPRVFAAMASFVVPRRSAALPVNAAPILSAEATPETVAGFPDWDAIPPSVPPEEAPAGPEQQPNAMESGQEESLGDSAAVVSECFLVFGGLLGNQEPSGDLFLYTLLPVDGVAHCALLTDALVGGYAPSPRYGHSMTAVPSKDGTHTTSVVVVGGVTRGNEYLHDCFLLEWTPVGMAWREVLLPAAVPVPVRAFHAAGWIPILEIIVLYGGEVNSRSVAEGWAYSPARDEWRLLAGPSAARAPGALCTMAVCGPRHADLHSTAIVRADAVACTVVIIGGLAIDERSLDARRPLHNRLEAAEEAAGEARGAWAHGTGQIVRFGTSLRFFASVALAKVLEHAKDTSCVRTG